MLDIAPVELRSRLEQGDPIQVIDIRQDEEYAAWHIAGSANLPVYDALRADESGPLLKQAASLDKARPVVAVCRAGVVSRKAAMLLQTLGYQAMSLAGGMRGWGAVWSEASIECREGVSLVQIRRNGKGCLSYLLASDGEAAVVDPACDVEVYVDVAERASAKIVAVLETHVHADHLSRARALCAATGARLLLPRNDRVRFPYEPLESGQRLTVGTVTVEAIATPGHTGESTSYLVDDAILLTGDTLFPEAVGRPDLERGDAGAQEGARRLHESVHTLLGRFDDLPFYAGHVGRPIGFDGQPIGSTLGAVRNGLELLQADGETFVRSVVERLGAKPSNYEAILAVNEGRASAEGISPLDLEAGPNCCAAG